MDGGADLISVLEDSAFNDDSLLEPGIGFTADIESMLSAGPAPPAGSIVN